MKIITKASAIKYLNEQIESLDSKRFRDDLEAFLHVSVKMDVFYHMGILKKEDLDPLWNKLQDKTHHLHYISDDICF